MSHRSIRSRNGRADFRAARMRRQAKETQVIVLRSIEPREKEIFWSGRDTAEHSDVVVSSDSQDESADSIRVSTATSTDSSTSSKSSRRSGKTTTSSTESSDIKVSTASTSSEAGEAEAGAPVWRPRKKNPVLKELRGWAWESRTKIVDAKKVVKQAGREAAKAARDATTPEYIKLVKRNHRHPTPAQIEKVKGDLEFEDRKREKWIGACIPDQLRSKTRAEEVLPFLNLLANGLLLDLDPRMIAMKEWLAQQRDSSRVHDIQADVKSYAQGLLDCDAALSQDSEACANRVNWLPKRFQQPFILSGRGDPEKWLWDLVDLQKHSAFKDQFSTFADAYEAERQKAKIPQHLIDAATSKEIAQALGYVAAWKAVDSKLHIKEYRAYGGKMKKLERKKKPARKAEVDD